MSIDLSRIPNRLKEAAATGILVPLIGAGLSKQAKTADKKEFPSWKELLAELKNDAVKHKHLDAEEGKQIDALFKAGRYLMAAQALRDVLPTDHLEDIITRRFTPPDAKPGEVHKWLFRLNTDIVLTTNYDMLIEDAFAVEFKKAPISCTFRHAPEVQRSLQSFRRGKDRPLIFKLHGCVGSVSDAVLSELDYRTLLYREPGYKMVLSAIFVTRVVLMLGFSFSDPELVLLTESLRESLKYRSSPDYILMPEGAKNSVERKRLRDDFGLEVIEYKPSPGHREVAQLVKYLAGVAGNTSAHSPSAKKKSPKKKSP